MKFRPYVYVVDSSNLDIAQSSAHSLRLISKELEIYFITCELKDQKKSALSEFSSNENIKLIDFKTDNYVFLYKSDFTLKSLAKLTLPLLLPQYDSCILVKESFIFSKKIKELDSIELGDYSGLFVTNKNFKNQDVINSCHNFDFIVFNLKTLRFIKNKEEDKIKLEDYNKYCLEILKKSLKGQILFINDKYNLQVEPVEKNITFLPSENIKSINFKLQKSYSYKISVIIPVFNVCDYLEECLESVIAQTFQDFEIIIVDDGSTDDSLAIAKKFADFNKNIRIVTQKNEGLSSARNAGLKEAKGEYIFFLDSDDKIAPETLEHLYNSVIKYDTDVAICSFQYFFSVKDQIHSIDTSWPLRFERDDGKYIVSEEIDKEICCVTWNKLYKHSIIKEYNLKFPVGLIHEDITWLWAYFSRINKYSYINERLYYYRIREGSITYKKKSDYFFGYLRPYEEVLKQNNLTVLQKNIILQRITFYSKKSLSNSNIAIKAKVLFNYVLINRKYFELDNPILKLLKRTKKSLISTKNNLKSGLKNKIKKVIYLLNDKNKILSSISELKESFNTRSRNQLTFTTILNQSVVENSVLIIETQACHGECIPSVVNYFKELGYHIDIWLSDKEFKLTPVLPEPGLRIFQVSNEILYSLASLPLVKRYDYIFLNTEWDYDNQTSVDRSYLVNIIDKRKILYLCHRPELSYNYLPNNSLKFTLGKISGYTSEVLSCCFFRKIFKHHLNDQIKFVVVGNIERKRKDFDLLIEAVNYVSFHYPSIRFEINVIARVGEFKIPDNLNKYIKFLGCLSYQDMYEKIQNSDFLLPLFNSDIPEHSRYLNFGVSGSVNLSLGFNKPMIIERTFAEHFGFDDNSSIIYSFHTGFTNAFISSLNINTIEYDHMCLSLSKLRDKLISDSLYSLKRNLRESM